MCSPMRTVAWTRRGRADAALSARAAFHGSRSEDVPAAVEPGAFSFQAMQREAEKRAIESALALAGGNKSKAAKLLGFSRNTLYLKMKALGMGSREKRREKAKRPESFRLSCS